MILPPVAAPPERVRGLLPVPVLCLPGELQEAGHALPINELEGITGKNPDTAAWEIHARPRPLPKNTK
jgi:hypothetical protein